MEPGKCAIDRTDITEPSWVRVSDKHLLFAMLAILLRSKYNEHPIDLDKRRPEDFEPVSPTANNSNDLEINSNERTSADRSGREAIELWVGWDQ